MNKPASLAIVIALATAGCADSFAPDEAIPGHDRNVAPAYAAAGWATEIASAPKAQLPQPDAPMPPGETVDPEQPVTPEEPTDPSHPIEPNDPIVFATDYCDEQTYSGATWQTYATDHFDIRYLPDTEAALQVQQIATRDEAYFNFLAEALGVTTDPSYTLNLSPNRVAATAHGLSRGVFYPAQMRIDVVHTGHDESFEMTQYGHELTHAVSDQLFEGAQRPLRIFDEGLAELLDSSNRDLHLTFAHRLLARGNPPDVPTAFTSRDIMGQDYGRAGSLVQHLVERFGFATFVEIFAGSAGSWSGGCFYDPELGCIDGVEAIEAAVAANVEPVTGVAWKTVAADWAEKVAAAMLVADRAAIPAKDRAEIEALLLVMDRAIEAGDADGYRSVMEGFYCDWGGESMRADIAARMVDTFTTSTTTIDTIHPVGTRNYPEMIAVVTQVTEDGPRRLELNLEKIGGYGWRISWIGDWR